MNNKPTLLDTSIPELQPGEVVLFEEDPDGIICYVEREDYYYIVNIQ